MNVETPQQIPVRDIATCVIIDGHTLIQSLGKPHDCKTFGEYANIFTYVMFNNFSNHTTIVDAVFALILEEEINQGFHMVQMNRKTMSYT